MSNLDLIPQEEVKNASSKATNIFNAMSAIKVTTAEQLTEVAGHIGSIKAIKKEIEAERDKYITPAKEIIKNAKDRFDPLIDKCDEAEKMMKQKAQDFMVEQKKIEQAEKEKIESKVESGYIKPETAVEKLSNVQEAPKSVKTENGQLGMKMVKKVKIVDETKIPEEYYKPRELDNVKIKKVALAGVVIPGVEVIEEPEMAFRG